MNKGIPSGWVTAKMLDIIDYEGGSQPPKKEFIYQPREWYIRLLQIRDFGKKPFPTYVPDSKHLKKATKDDLLLARYGGSSASDSLGRICTGLDGAYNVALAKIIFTQKYLYKNFIKYLFMGPWFREIVSKNSRSCQTGFNRDDIEDVIFPLAPITEQRRIVEKLDRLLHKVNACKERLEKIPAILKRFRQSVLAAACSGRLTADWREQHANIEPASVLLKQMCRDSIGNARCEGAYDIPDKWSWIKFHSLIAAIRGGSTVPPQNELTDYPILRSSSVRAGFVDLDDVRFVREQDSKNSYNFLCDGDLLFTRLSGSLEYVANCAMVRNLDGRQIQYPDRIFCAKLKSPDIAHYLEICFSNPILRSEITDNAKSSAGHQRVSIPDIKSQKIPFPPLPEQKEIVRHVEALFKKADEIEARYKKAKGFVDRLTQSILAKAFRGELVPQDPNDEPASVLLERIWEERAKHKKGTKGGKRRKWSE